MVEVVFAAVVLPADADAEAVVVEGEVALPVVVDSPAGVHPARNNALKTAKAG